MPSFMGVCTSAAEHEQTESFKQFFTYIYVRIEEQQALAGLALLLGLKLLLCQLLAVLTSFPLLYLT